MDIFAVSSAALAGLQGVGGSIFDGIWAVFNAFTGIFA